MGVVPVFMTGIILSGGESKRMGSDKAFIKVGGETLIERVVTLFKEIFTEVIIVSNNIVAYEGLGVRVVSDVMDVKGSLVGIYSGLIHSNHPYSFVAGCDMPFLNKELIQYMISLEGNYDILVPKVDGHYEPIHAVYSARCVKCIERSIKNNNLKIIDTFKQLKIKTVDEDILRRYDPDLLFKANVNTKSDMAKAMALEKRRKASL